MFPGPGLRCYNGVGANAKVVNCEDVASGTKYCIKLTSAGMVTRSCGLSVALEPLKKVGVPIPGCKTIGGVEMCACSGDKCN